MAQQSVSEGHCVLPPFPRIVRSRSLFMPAMLTPGRRVVSSRCCPPRSCLLKSRRPNDYGSKNLTPGCLTQDCLKEYKDTRNGMLGGDYSSKFSAWLAHGCISPRYIHSEVRLDTAVDFSVLCVDGALALWEILEPEKTRRLFDRLFLVFRTD